MITICTRTTCEYFRSYTYCAAEVCPFPTEQSTTGSIWNIKQPITNAGRIRSMTDEDLAEWIHSLCDCDPPCPRFQMCYEEDITTGPYVPCKDKLLNWLKQEVQE